MSGYDHSDDGQELGLDELLQPTTHRRASMTTRKRRSATEQAADIQKDLRRARMTFIAEGDEPMAVAMHELEKQLTGLLEMEPSEAIEAWNRRAPVGSDDA